MIDLPRLMSDEEGEAYLIELCAINISHIENTLQNHAALYGAAELAFEMAEVEVARIKKALYDAEVVLFNQIQHKEKGLAVTKTDRLVAAHPSIMEKQDELIDAQASRGRLRALCKGLISRKDMLIQISSRQKQE